MIYYYLYTTSPPPGQNYICGFNGTNCLGQCWLVVKMLMCIWRPDNVSQNIRPIKLMYLIYFVSTVSFPESDDLFTNGENGCSYNLLTVTRTKGWITPWHPEYQLMSHFTIATISTELSKYPKIEFYYMWWFHKVHSLHVHSYEYVRCSLVEWLWLLM